MELQQDATVTNKYRWDDDQCTWQWSWQWSWTNIGGRETGELDILSNLLHHISPSSGKKDGWLWSWTTYGTFSVKVLTSVLDEIVIDHCGITTLESPLVPKKVNILMWRARRNFLPTRLQVALRRVSIQSVSCPLCDNRVEDYDHALLPC